MKKLILLCLLAILAINTQAEVVNPNKPSMTGFLFKDQVNSNRGSKVVKQLSSAEQVSKTVNVPTAGTLNSLLTNSDKATVTDLTINGQLDARDFRIIRDSLPLLAQLDISGVSIQGYAGSDGTISNQSFTYLANKIPVYAFCKEDLSTPNTILKAIVFPLAATSIGGGAFALCQGFTSLTIPSTIANIEDAAFLGFWGDIKVDVNNPTYSDANGVLMDKAQQRIMQCPTSKSGIYTVLPGVSSIGVYSFYGCNLLTGITLSGSVTSIESFAFSNCTGLTSISVTTGPDKIKMGIYCFNHVNTSGCALNVPFGTQSSYEAADQWNSFSNIVEDAHGFIVNPTSLLLASKGSVGRVAITSTDAWTVSSDQTWITLSKISGTGNDTLDVTVTENSLNDNRTALLIFSITGYDSQTVTINQSGLLKTVSSTAGGLSSIMTAADLSSVSNLKITGTIDASDFKALRDNMPKLSSLDISEATIAAYNGSQGTSSWVSTYAANTIPDFSFNQEMRNQNFTLTTVMLPANITAIGSYAFYSCKALKGIVIPNSVTEIGVAGFGSCSNLSSVNIPDHLTSIESEVFSGCAFSRINLPNTVTSIGSYAFENCQNLRIVVIPNSVTTISNSAFVYCSVLTDLTIGNSVTYIGGSAFSRCSGLSSVCIPNSVTTLDGSVFAYCPNLKSVILPNSLGTIDRYNFYQCTNLTNIIIPASVTKIDNSAFSYCRALTNITIPPSVTSIANSAFSNCSGLKSITVENNFPVDLSSSVGVFTGVDILNCILNVPYGSKAAYASADQWKDFLNIVETPTGLSAQKANSINIYPNPITGSFRINGLNGEVILSILDLSGKRILTKQVNGNEMISVENLPKGVYVAWIITNEGSLKRKLVLK